MRHQVQTELAQMGQSLTWTFLVKQERDPFDPKGAERLRVRLSQMNVAPSSWEAPIGMAWCGHIRGIWEMVDGQTIKLVTVGDQKK